MKKQVSSFAAGAITMALIGGLGFSALAATGGVSFNASNLMLNGQQISAKGEDYALANGCMAPSSITYTDEKGGGTTYLPVRRISELLGVETGWDGATGSVTVKGDVKTPGTTPDPDTAALPADYSDWTAEEEAAYQEFKGLWEERTYPQGPTMWFYYYSKLSYEDIKYALIEYGENTVKKYSERMAEERYSTLALSEKEIEEIKKIGVTGIEVQFEVFPEKGKGWSVSRLWGGRIMNGYNPRWSL